MSLEKLSEKDKPMEQIKSSILPRFSLKDIGRKLDKLDSDKPNVVQNIRLKIVKQVKKEE